MLSRITAWYLVVLVLAPFTAPFPTIDLAAFFASSNALHSPVHDPGAARPIVARLSKRRMAEDAPPHDPFSTTFGSREDSVASIPARSAVGRVRLIRVSRTSESPDTPPGSARRSPQPIAPPSRISDLSVISTNLRL